MLVFHFSKWMLWRQISTSSCIKTARHSTSSEFRNACMLTELRRNINGIEPRMKASFNFTIDSFMSAITNTKRHQPAPVATLKVCKSKIFSSHLKLKRSFPQLYVTTFLQHLCLGSCCSRGKRD